MTTGTTTTTWDNDGQWIRHRATSKTPSLFPGRLENFLLFIALFRKRVALEASSLKRATLCHGETVFLWVRFVVRYYVPKAPAKAASIVVSISIAIQKESVHANIRRLAVTTMYSVGGLVLIAIAPKIVMIVWAI